MEFKDDYFYTNEQSLSAHLMLLVVRVLNSLRQNRPQHVNPSHVIILLTGAVEELPVVGAGRLNAVY